MIADSFCRPLQWDIEFPRDHWLPQIDSLKLSSLLPPKRSDPSRQHTHVDGKVGEAVDEKDEEEGVAAGSTKGLGRVQDVTLVKGRSDEFGSHELDPLEEEEDYDEEGQARSNCCIM